jgi:hypothetical protein
MRRNKKLGVYSGHSIKRCFCDISEMILKARNERKLYKFGNGKIEGRDNFVQFDKKNHKKHSCLRYFKFKAEALRKSDLKALAREMEREYLCWN